MLRRVVASDVRARVGCAAVLASRRFDSTKYFGPEEDPNAPPEELKKRILRKLWDVNRRVSLAPDYGAIFMCQYLNDSGEFISDIQSEARKYGVDDDEDIIERIEEIQEKRRQLLFENELDRDGIE